MKNKQLWRGHNGETLSSPVARADVLHSRGRHGAEVMGCLYLDGDLSHPGSWDTELLSVKTGLRETHQVHSYRIQSKLQGVTYLFRWHFLPPGVSILLFQSSSQEGNALIVYSRLQLSSPTAKPVLILLPW